MSLEQKLEEMATYLPSRDDRGVVKQAAARVQSDAETIRQLKKTAIQQPSPLDRGGFIGDIFFGDPHNSTRGTHRWNGSAWVALPSDAEVLAELLAEARSRAEAAEALLADTDRAMRIACDLLAERIQGSRARSPGHNARLILEAAISNSKARDQGEEKR